MVTSEVKIVTKRIFIGVTLQSVQQVAVCCQLYKFILHKLHCNKHGPVKSDMLATLQAKRLLDIHRSKTKAKVVIQEKQRLEADIAAMSKPKPAIRSP